jgi:hypothetical protein
MLRRLKALVLAAVMALVALNVWTGGPLLALWVGSRVQGGGPPSMTAIAVIVGMLAVVSLVLVRLLAVLGRAYDDVTGASRTRRRRQAPWLRSMRGERADLASGEIGLSALERVLIVCVVLAAATFEVWFFFFAGSSIG